MGDRGRLARSLEWVNHARVLATNLVHTQIRSQPRATVHRPSPCRYDMLELSRRLGQVDAGQSTYDFSLNFHIPSSSQALQPFLPETAICEQHPLDARHGVADCRSVLPLRGQMGWTPASRGGDFDRAIPGFDQCSSEPVEQPLLQRAPGKELGWLCNGDRLLFHSGHVLHRPVRLPALSQPMASDPLAALVDLDLSQRM